LDCLTCTSAAPILGELGLVKLGPCEDETELAAREAVLDRLEAVDSDLGVVICVLGMEVWVTVLIAVHRNHDSIEHADPWHAQPPVLSSI
jgi:hypothetical protein